MPGTSTILFSLLLAAASAVAGLLIGLGRRPKPEPPDPRDTYLRSAALRLACAQHWARGGAMSFAAEAWRPVCLGAAVAALLVRDDRELLALLNELVADSATDAELANIWKQARGELMDGKASGAELGIAFLSGHRPDGSPDWNYPELGLKARESLQNAQIHARKLLEIRRSPPAQSTDPPRSIS